MKSDGLTLLSGSPAVTNITVENGTALPAAVAGNKGRLFYLTQTDGSYSPGLYTSDGSAWVTGDINGVIAGTGLTGGGTTGTVTLNVDTNVVATKSYVDSAVSGLAWKTSVRAASTTNITLSGVQTIDSVVLQIGDSVLVKDQSNQVQNGVYLVASGAWTYRSDVSTSAQITQAAVFVREGTVNQDTAWVCTNDTPNLGVSNIVFTQFGVGASYAAGTGLNLSANTFSVKLGAGVANLPAGEVGVDLYAGGGLMLTADGTSTSTAAGAQLALAASGVSADIYGSATRVPVLTVDTKGRVTKVGTVPLAFNNIGDQYFNNVSTLLHFDGPVGSSSFLDCSYTPKTFTIGNGAPILNGTSKFGGSSAYFDGNASSIITPATAAGPFDLSSGDFTVEFWMRRSEAQTTRHLVGTAEPQTGGGGWGIRLDGGALVLVGGSIGQGSVAFSWVDNTWYHIAVCRSGTITKVFVNGTQAGANLSPSFQAESGANLCVGYHIANGVGGSAVPGLSFKGNLEELRITKGIARYTSNFTVETLAFPSQTATVGAITAGTGISVNSTNPNNPIVSISSAFTPYDISSCVLGKPDASATVFMALAVRSFTIPASYTGSQAKAGVAATASSVFTIYKNGGSIGTFTFASSGTIATFSGAGGSIVAGDLITITAPGSQDATLANIAFTIAGNLL